MGHKILSSTEHGWQGKYHECYELAKKYRLKFIFGTEAYWVKDRHDGDRTNNHIVLLAKNENGRREINGILSEANETGYYYKPRVDLELLMSLPPQDVMVTTACVAFWRYDDSEEIVKQLHSLFKDNLYLEIQYHNTDKQIQLNRKIKSISETYGIKMIVGLDSHYIYPEQAQERELILDMKYEDEDGWYMDYPDDNTVMRRFLEQGVFSQAEVRKAMDNTDVLLDFEDYDVLPDGSPNPVFSKEIKLPTLYDGKHWIDGKLLPKLTQQERNKEYSKLVTKRFKEYMKDIPQDMYDMYFEGVKSEVNVIKETNMADYFLIDYYIVKQALADGGILTNTGRGSAVSYFTNTLLGFSKVDRFKSPIRLYPERFISKSRILETKSLPDIDMNWGTPEIAEEAQRKVLGDNHAYPMIAFGTCKKKKAFKLYAKSQDMEFALANEISKQIDKYDDAYKYADDEERKEIDIYDYIDKKYVSYVDASSKYWGIISDKKKAPCAYLLYAGDIRKEIGLIKCKAEHSTKEYITAVIDGVVAEEYKFLKNDLLKVDVSLLTDMVFRDIGIKPYSVDRLTELVKGDEAVWDIYAKGLTIGINQCEKPSTIKKVMKYKPQNVSELAAFIAAIRPAFKSMYSKLENRESFEYGIPAFDRILQTRELPQSFILYQEQTMNVLNYAGFPIDECYGIIKAIAKKHPEKVRPLKSRFIEGFMRRIREDDNVSEQNAKEMSSKVWQIISDSCGYGFNCVSGETKILRAATNGKFRPTIEEMYRIKTDSGYAKRTGHFALHKKYKQYGYGGALSMFDDNRIHTNKIVNIVPAGIRQTYRLRTEHGGEIICTANHKFPTPNGKKRLDELKCGEVLYCKGEYEQNDFDSSRLSVYLDKIICIEPYKVEKTYDIEMAAPAYNFITESGLIASNSSHAYCMALDSLYQAYQKAHYPYEFYETLLQVYSDKGKKDKVAELKREMLRGFGIREGDYKFGLDNRRFVSDKEHRRINPSLLSVKGLSQAVADTIYEVSQRRKFIDFYDLWKEMDSEKVLAKDKIITLVEMDYFSEFGSINKLKCFLEAITMLYKRKTFKKTELPKGYEELIKKYSVETAAQYRKFDRDAALHELWNKLPDSKCSLQDKLNYELKHLGYVKTVVPKMLQDYCFCQDYECSFKNPILTLYRLCDGKIERIKVRAGTYNKSPIKIGDIIKIVSRTKEGKWYKNSDGDWKQDKDNKECILLKWNMVKD